MTAVVTGASGHVGSNLCRALLAGGQAVRAVDLRRAASIEGVDVEFVPGDILDPEGLRAAFAGADVVYHLAARISIAGDPGGHVWRTNVDGARHAAEAALDAGARRFVHCSSLHAFDVAGRAGRPVDESTDGATDPQRPVYDRSKAAGEAEVRRGVDRGLDAVIVNPSGIFGPEDHEPSAMGRVLLAAFRGRLPAVMPGAFDWVDVRDVVRAAVAAAERGRTGENYLIGGHRASVAEIAGLAARVAGRRPPRFSVPVPVLRLAAEVAVRVTPPRRRSRLLLTPESLHAVGTDPVVDASRARRELGHKPRPLEETVADLHAFFRAAGRLG